MLGYSECDAVSELLWNYAANRLSEAQTLHVESHILTCSSCRKEMEGYRAAVSALTGLKQSPVPESRANWRDLQARLTAQPTRRPLFSFNSWRVPSLAWGSLAVASVLGVFFFGRPLDQSLVAHQPSHSGVSLDGARHSPDIASGDSSDTGYDEIMDNELDSAPLTDKSQNRTAAPRNRTLSGHHSSHSAIHWVSASYRSDARTARTVRRSSVKPALDYDAVDGGRSSAGTDNENFVLTPVTSALESETPSNYVIGSVSTTVRPVSSSYDSDATEAHGW